MRTPREGDGRHHHGGNQAAADYQVSWILSNWLDKDQYIVVATEPATWRGVQHGMDAPQQDSTRDDRVGRALRSTRKGPDR